MAALSAFRFACLLLLAITILSPGSATQADFPTNKTLSLEAGAARVDITDPGSLSTRDRLHARALVLRSGDTQAVLIAVDAVAIGGIGYIPNDYLDTVRARLQKDLGIDPASVTINASHCHGVVCKDIADKTVQAVKLAHATLTPVLTSAATGKEDRIQENRRLRLKDGREADVRHAYALPPEAQVTGSGPIDPDIGLLRLDKPDGTPVAVVFQFACHPIMALPDGSNTADLSGFAARVIEDSLGGTALFLQGCGGDINPIRYKDTTHPRDAEPLGTLLGTSALKALRGMQGKPSATLKIYQEKILLPRADLIRDIARLEGEQNRLVASFKGTSLDLKGFLQLQARQKLSPEFPSAPSHQYLHEKKLGRADLEKTDTVNRQNLQAYIDNIHTMEELTRVQANLALLRRHQKENQEAGMRPLAVEVMGLRVGEFCLVTFPGELTVEIGLGLKKAANKPNCHVSGYTNGYIYYTPTRGQLKNRGGAQEDSDCLVDANWQEVFEKAALKLFKKLDD